MWWPCHGHVISIQCPCDVYVLCMFYIFGYYLFIAFLQVEHTFSNYGPGLRYIQFIHRGKDTKYWAGHYGSKMAGAQVGIRKKIRLITTCIRSVRAQIKI